MIFAALGVFAGLSMNLVFQFAFGAVGLVKSKGDAPCPAVPFAQILCLFLSVLVFWILYYYILGAFSGGFLESFLVFPLSALVCYGVETLVWKMAARKTPIKSFSALSGYNGLVPVAFILTSRLAMTFSDGIILSFFFALGCLVAALVIVEIRRRAFLERVPSCIRGSPLALISMGLLSMASAGIIGICFRILGFF